MQQPSIHSRRQLIKIHLMFALQTATAPAASSQVETVRDVGKIRPVHYAKPER
jgi:hypothetical protein